MNFYFSRKKKFFYLILIILIFIKTNYKIYDIKNDKIYIEVDNQLSEYENNIDFSQYATDIKVIALYLPQFHSIKENDNWWGKGFTEWVNVKKSIPLYKGHHQPRKPGDKLNYLGYYELINPNIIKKQVELAKSHGIYGFGIYYYWFSGKRLLEKPVDIYLNNKDINFPFLLIWANENWTKRWDGKDKEILIKQEYKKEDPENFIKDIKKYLIDPRYIKINNKSVLGIYEPNKIPKLNETISKLRTKSKEYEIGELFILITFNENKNIFSEYIYLFDGAYDFPPRTGLGEFKVKFKDTFIYSELIYKALLFNINNITNKKDFQIFRGSMLEWDNCPRRKDCFIFDYYSPEQFYILNKIIIDWTKKFHNNTNKYIFINAWNEWGEGTYLEPDEKYGYASINSLSKAIFNLKLVQNYNLNNLNEKSQIAIHVHLYYEELINEIINKTNNIPCRFDLYISIANRTIKENIENSIKLNSKADKFEVKILPNKGRDILPLLIQLKNVIKNYKYFCHIHTKKSNHIVFGDEWRNYLFNNLIGNSEIISEILTDFENNKKLGFIFPEPYYKTLDKFGIQKYDSNYNYMNFILKKLFSKYRIKNDYFDYPSGNMFWAKVNAVYQIFNFNKKYFPKEKGQLNLTIIHGIERLWLFIVKINGYYYKKIFKHF